MKGALWKPEKSQWKLKRALWKSSKDPFKAKSTFGAEVLLKSKRVFLVPKRTLSEPK